MSHLSTTIERKAPAAALTAPGCGRTGLEFDMVKPMPLKGVCSIEGCGRAVATLRRCKPHRAQMTPDEIVAGRIEANARKAAAKVGANNPMHGKTGEASPRWKGEAVSYGGLHDWLTENFGQPKCCEQCGTTDPNDRYEWANVSGEYRRERTDFKRLCKKCHNDHDRVNRWQVAPARRNRAMKTVNGKPVSSRFKGVRASGHGTWRATLKVGVKVTNLGSFPTEEAAARAYNAAVLKTHGADAFLNDLS